MGDVPARRASDIERDRVIALLREASVDGRLTFEEFTDRMDVALQSSTTAELEPLIADLASRPAPGPATRWVFGIFGGGNRRGRWTVGRQVNVVDIFGGSGLDLREAAITAREVTITAVAVFGGANIIVPEGAEVDLSGGALFGGNDLKLHSGPIAGAPCIRVRAFSLFGGITIEDRPRRRR